MDTHKKQHAVDLVHPDTGEVQAFTVNNTAKDIKKMVKKIQRKPPGEVRFCYEAGVCGFTWAMLHKWQRRRAGDIPQTQDVSLATTDESAFC